jgi:Transposase DDE domain
VLLADLAIPTEEDTKSASASADQTTATADQGAADQVSVIYGDAAYGTGALLAELEGRGITAMTKVAAPTAPAGHFTKQQFRIDLEAGTVTCPTRLSVPITPARGGGGLARFGRACAICPLATLCTSSMAGRTIAIHPHEARLQAARRRQQDPAWRTDYRAHRPTVERKLAHLLRRRHGGRQHLPGRKVIGHQTPSRAAGMPVRTRGSAAGRRPTGRPGR